MNIKLLPNSNGYVCNWLISGTYVTTPEVNFSDPNQLKFEKDLRAVIADENLKTPPNNIELGKEGLPGLSWKYYRAGNNWFIDTSTFYFLLKKVELYAYTELNCEKDMLVNTKLRTFAAVDLWLNNEHTAKIKTPVYKPINNLDMVLDLKKGKNTIFIKMQNLGVRDTRNIIGLQLLGDLKGITVSLPDLHGTLDSVIKTDQWLNDIIYNDGKLKAKSEPPCAVTLKAYTKESNLNSAFVNLKCDEIIWNSGCDLEIDRFTQRVVFSTEVSEQYLERTLEIGQNIKPEFDDVESSSPEEHRNNIIKKLADFKATNFKSDIKDSSYHVLCRYICGNNTVDDHNILMSELDLVYKRQDCADFWLSACLRIFLKFNVADVKVRERMKEVCLDFRYWMDENGSDGMCFWSENHALLFHGSQMLAGQLYPNEIFTRSGRSGSEQARIGANRCREWLQSVDENGFEEFLSGGYMCVTSAALLNLIDFSPEDISKQATKVLDKLLIQLSKHTHHGVVCGPQGRVYRDVIYPFKQGVQALMYFITPAVPKALSMWTASFGCTKYQIPDFLVKLMDANADETYPNGNSEIIIKKTKDYILTSVNSPKMNNKGWSNDAYENSNPYQSGEFTYDYTKALNERFHGTSLFEPGVYGYQQHMWYALLEINCPVFVNHPGGTHDGSEMRPGYWYGNGLMPAIKQQGNMLGLIYHLREEHPVNFTHLYWPSQEFDRIAKKDGWLIGKKGNSYVAIWCNIPFTPHNDMLIDREYRAYGEKIAYLCYCSCADESGDLEVFMENMVKKSPEFTEESMELVTSEGYQLKFVEKHNYSQYI